MLVARATRGEGCGKEDCERVSARNNERMEETIKSISNCSQAGGHGCGFYATKMSHDLDPDVKRKNG